MKGQKEFVVETITTMLPGFKRCSDVALVMLTKDQLEFLKSTTAAAIISGDVEYGKDRTKSSEVYAYARSMVMNHLKKAKELNGNQTYGKSTAQVEAVRASKALDGIDLDMLPEDLTKYVNSLV